jgi:Zn-finger nucleic acid-binding protein
LWVSVETFNEICADRDKQAAVLGGASPPPAPLDPTVAEVRYLPCPECHTLMNRVNFAGHSGVIIDVCRGHGTWFDRDELQHIVEFIRAGGLEESRARELERLEAARVRRTPTLGIEGSAFGDASEGETHAGWAAADFIANVAEALAWLIRK